MAYGTAAEVLENMKYISDTDDEVLRLEVDNGQVYISDKFSKITHVKVTPNKSTWGATDAISVVNVSSAGVEASSLDGTSPAIKFITTNSTTDLTVSVIIKGEQ